MIVLIETMTMMTIGALKKHRILVQWWWRWCDNNQDDTDDNDAMISIVLNYSIDFWLPTMTMRMLLTRVTMIICSINSGLPIITGCWLQEEVLITVIPIINVIIALRVIIIPLDLYHHHCHLINLFCVSWSWCTPGAWPKLTWQRQKNISDNYETNPCKKDLCWHFWEIRQLIRRQLSMLRALHSWQTVQRKICWGNWGRSLGWRTRSAWSSYSSPSFFSSFFSSAFSPLSSSFSPSSSSKRTKSAWSSLFSSSIKGGAWDSDQPQLRRCKWGGEWGGHCPEEAQSVFLGEHEQTNALLI